MKPMLDKDFDQLFKASFEDYEVTPTANSWDKIAAGLDKKPASKKKFPFYWASAASIVIILGIGISLYIKPTEVIQLRPDQPKEKLAEIGHQNDESNSANKGTEVVVSNKTVLKSAKKQREFLADNQAQINTKNDLADQNPVFKINSTEETTELENVNPVKVAALNQKTLANREIGKTPMINIAPEPVLAQNDINDSEIDQQHNGKLKITSIGDIVNFVVSKVDKREDKIIKMSKTENSDNEITGINLGLISFKRSY